MTPGPATPGPPDDEGCAPLSDGERRVLASYEREYARSGTGARHGVSRDGAGPARFGVALLTGCAVSVVSVLLLGPAGALLSGVVLVALVVGRVILAERARRADPGAESSGTA